MTQIGAIALILGLTIGSCFLRPGGNSETVSPVSIEDLSDGQKLITNESEGIRLTIPEGWELVEELRPDADIYAANEPENMYVMVLADDEDSLIGEFDLADNARQYRSIIVRQLDQYEGQTPTSVTSVNGQPAEQYEIRGQIDNTPIVYLHTTIRGEANYYQVVGWTRADRYETAQRQLQDVVETFRGA
ncbi:MAG: hypothetical protein F6J97_06515 [Leptolyngbya sp. SIO4C1]|nr:hypothetical protein [Leptolyngbya sp. SIO4C1]